jgi:hypothetical protein
LAASGTGGRESNRLDSILSRDPQRIPITIRQCLSLATLPTAPNRTNRVDDEPGRQMISACQLRFTLFTAAQRSAFREQFRASGAMNCTVDSAAAKKCRVGCVHDRINIKSRDIAANDLHFVLRIFFHYLRNFARPRKRCEDASHSKALPARINGRACSVLGHLWSAHASSRRFLNRGGQPFLLRR